MAVTALSVRQTAERFGVGKRSQARHRLADLNAEAARLSVQSTALQARCNRARACQAAVSGAEAALAKALFEAEVEAVALTKTRKSEMREAIRDARAGAEDTAEAEAEIVAVNTAFREVQAKRHDILRQIVLEDGRRLAAAYHRHAKLALGYKAAMDGLAMWATWDAEDSATGITLQTLVKVHPDDAEGAKITERLRTALDEATAAWRGVPVAILNRDVDASGPEPVEAAEDRSHAA